MSESKGNVKRVDFSVDIAKEECRDSSFHDGGSTLVSSLPSEASNSTHSNRNKILSKTTAESSKLSRPNKKCLVILIVVLGISILGLGYWVGWFIGARRDASKSSSIDLDADSLVRDPTSRPSQTPPTVLPTENHHKTPASGTAASPVATSSDPPLKPQTGIPVDSAKLPTDPPNQSLPTPSPSKKPMDMPTKVSVEWPTRVPTKVPVERPTQVPTKVPLEGPTQVPTKIPTKVPTKVPVEKPTNVPTKVPVTAPVKAPVRPPVRLKTKAPAYMNVPLVPEQGVEVTYIPGDLTRLENNLLLSEGLKARVIAQSGKRVEYIGGSASDIEFHILPDAGATFPDTRWWNDGGWIYVSNSEARNETEGGVGAITFDKDGSVVHYNKVLENTHMNCGGGRTPWNTWVSCEEVEFTGQIYQVDPTGQRPPEKMTIGNAGGRWESFAYDVRNKDKPRFFSTEDHNKGCTRRFTPGVTHWGGDEWKMLHEEGVVDYLFVIPNEELTGGTFKWINDLKSAKNNAKTYYPQSEGIDILDGKMYIVCKKIQQLFTFDLDKMIFQNVSTVSGLFDGDPDQMQRIVGGDGGLLYFTEEGGKDAGVHARDEFGRFFTILESPYLLDETTGLSFSPDGKHLYVAYQENGLLYDVTREDGLAFDAKSLDVKYHNSMSSRRLNSQWIGL